MKKPTLDQIAIECGVTKGLVSRALGGKTMSPMLQEKRSLERPQNSVMTLLNLKSIKSHLTVSF